jgi:esterase/lipase superfamily enzyme
VDKTVEEWVSPRLQRPIKLARWGHYGVPVVVFPTAGGDAEEIERHHLVSHLRDMIDGGAIKLYSCDSVAGAVMLRKEGSPEYRMWLLNQFQQAIAHEVVPAIFADSGGHHQPVVVSGASIGAFNALAVLCRYPELFRNAICMSGTYNLESFMGGFSDDLYFASPIHFVPGLLGPALDELRQRLVILASGEGAWEDVGESWAAARVLGEKGIPNRVDSWGPDWEHEWPTWWAMLPQYLKELLG